MDADYFSEYVGTIYFKRHRLWASQQLIDAWNWESSKKFEMWVAESDWHFLSTKRRQKLISDSNSAQKSQSRCINSEKLGKHLSIENNGSLVKMILGCATRLFCVFEIFFSKSWITCDFSFFKWCRILFWVRWYHLFQNAPIIGFTAAIRCLEFEDYLWIRVPYFCHLLRKFFWL